METIVDIDGLTVTLLRKRVKNLNLRIKPTGKVQISAPIKMPLDKVFLFVQQKRSWIETHCQRLLTSQPPKQLESGSMLFYLGQRYELIIYQSQNPSVKLEHGRLNLFTQFNSSLQNERILNLWYREQMLQLLPALFAKWQTIIGVHADSYGIKLMKSRWGSCHTFKKHICLNLRLIHKPLICLEYVIVHELVHLLEASHNKRFHALMSQFMPDWKAVKRQLNS